MGAFGQRLREVRRSRAWTLRTLAARTGLSASHLCDVEHGAEQPSPRALQKMADAYGMSVRELTGGTWRPDSRAQRRLRTRGSELRRLFRFVRPRPPEGTLAVLCREAAFYRLGRLLIERLRAQTRGAAFWVAVRLFLHGQNGAEQVASLHLLDQAVDLEDIEPHHLGFHRPVVQERGRRWIAILIKRGVHTFLFHAQVTVKSITGQYPTLDFLVSATDGRHTWYVAVEVDGPGHEATRFKDAERDVNVNTPVLRVPLRELDREDFVDRLLDRIVNPP